MLSEILRNPISNKTLQIALFKQKQNYHHIRLVFHFHSHGICFWQDAPGGGRNKTLIAHSSFENFPLPTRKQGWRRTVSLSGFWLTGWLVTHVQHPKVIWGPTRPMSKGSFRPSPSLIETILLQPAADDSFKFVLQPHSGFHNIEISLWKQIQSILISSEKMLEIGYSASMLKPNLLNFDVFRFTLWPSKLYKDVKEFSEHIFWKHRCAKRPC